jgi:hypothetical protein
MQKVYVGFIKPIKNYTYLRSSPKISKNVDKWLKFIPVFAKLLLIPLVLSIFAAVVAYSFGKIDERRKSELDEINLQIEKLYGPLYAYTLVNKAAWDAYKGKPNWSSASEAEIEAWRRWMKSVFFPINAKIEIIITEISS